MPFPQFHQPNVYASPKPTHAHLDPILKQEKSAQAAPPGHAYFPNPYAAQRQAQVREHPRDDYWAINLKDNPLGLENMIRAEEISSSQDTNDSRSRMPALTSDLRVSDLVPHNSYPPESNSNVAHASRHRPSSRSYGGRTSVPTEPAERYSSASAAAAQMTATASRAQTLPAHRRHASAAPATMQAQGMQHAKTFPGDALAAGTKHVFPIPRRLDERYDYRYQGIDNESEEELEEDEEAKVDNNPSQPRSSESWGYTEAPPPSHSYLAKQEAPVQTSNNNVAHASHSHPLSRSYGGRTSVPAEPAERYSSTSAAAAQMRAAARRVPTLPWYASAAPATMQTQGMQRATTVPGDTLAEGTRHASPTHRRVTRIYDYPHPGGSNERKRELSGEADEEYIRSFSTTPSTTNESESEKGLAGRKSTPEVKQEKKSKMDRVREWVDGMSHAATRPSDRYHLRSRIYPSSVASSTSTTSSGSVEVMLPVLSRLTQRSRQGRRSSVESVPDINIQPPSRPESTSTVATGITLLPHLTEFVNLDLELDEKSVEIFSPTFSTPDITIEPPSRPQSADPFATDMPFPSNLISFGRPDLEFDGDNDDILSPANSVPDITIEPPSRPQSADPFATDMPFPSNLISFGRPDLEFDGDNDDILSPANSVPDITIEPPSRPPSTDSSATGITHPGNPDLELDDDDDILSLSPVWGATQMEPWRSSSRPGLMYSPPQRQTGGTIGPPTSGISTTTPISSALLETQENTQHHEIGKNIEDYVNALNKLLSKLKDLDLTSKIQGETFRKASGGYADVYMGRLVDEAKPIAIKQLRIYEQQHNPRKFLKNIAKELRVWSKVQHPNILPLKGYKLEVIHGTHWPSLSFITEWMEAGSMMQYVRENRNLNNVKLFKGVANGLCYLHMNGIIHGDLKAANVLISADGAPLLTDFGLSHLITSTSTFETATDASKGSSRWQSPELIIPRDSTESSGRIHTKESDIWAFGMTGLEILTKDFPYTNLKTDGQVFINLYKGTLPLDPSDLKDWIESDKRLWGLCKGCWAIDPLHRPSINHLLQAINQIM